MLRKDWLVKRVVERNVAAAANSSAASSKRIEKEADTLQKADGSAADTEWLGYVGADRCSSEYPSQELVKRGKTSGAAADNGATLRQPIKSAIIVAGGRPTAEGVSSCAAFQPRHEDDS